MYQSDATFWDNVGPECPSKVLGIAVVDTESPGLFDDMQGKSTRSFTLATNKALCPATPQKLVNLYAKPSSINSA